MKHTPMLLEALQTTLTGRLTPEKLSTSSNASGNQPLFGTDSMAPLAETLQILHGK